MEVQDAKPICVVFAYTPCKSIPEERAYTARTCQTLTRATVTTATLFDPGVPSAADTQPGNALILHCGARHN